jgi:hypothetical protein
VQTAGLTNYYVVDQRIHMYSFFLKDDLKVTSKRQITLDLR